VLCRHGTCYDVWHVSESPVTVDMVIQTLNKNTTFAQEAIRILAGNLKTKRACNCEHTLAEALITQHNVIPDSTSKKLDLLVKKYL
jgi:5'-methylthioadenosine phosphorylase